MRRLAAALIIGLASNSFISCKLSYHDAHFDAPPSDPKKAARWWDELVNIIPPSALAAYVEVSEIHISQGTSATYVHGWAGCNMLGAVGYRLALPSPPPPGTLDRLREKLKGCDLAKSSKNRNYEDDMKAEDCHGCTAEEANLMWRNAAKKYLPERKSE